MTAPETRTPDGNRASADETAGSASIITAAAPASKAAVAVLTRDLQLAGFSVHPLPSDGFLVSKWGLTKHCPDERALAGFANQVGVRT